MPFKGLNWNWERQPEIEIAILRPLENQAPRWKKPAYQVQEQEMERAIDPISCKVSGPLFSADNKGFDDIKKETEDNSRSIQQPDPIAAEMAVSEQDPEAFQLANKSQPCEKSTSQPVPNVVDLKIPGDMAVEFDFENMTREMYHGYEMGNIMAPNGGIRISTPEFETEGMNLNLPGSEFFVGYQPM